LTTRLVALSCRAGLFGLGLGLEIRVRKIAPDQGLGGKDLARAVSLSVSLFVLWLLLSGHYEPLILVLGAVSCVFIAWIAYRMDVVDREGHPIHLTWRSLVYWPWLLWEIVKANLEVARLILAPRMAISPTVIKVKASQPDELGQVIYANSITLTPGTVSIDVRDATIEVHAITREMAEGLQTGEMDRRVTQMEGAG
jgi:multicomponent Na+:H+ antiporter subunit E